MHHSCTGFSRLIEVNEPILNSHDLNNNLAMRVRVVFTVALIAICVVAFPMPSQLLQVEGTAPPQFQVELDTMTNGKASKITIEVTREWAPRGADRSPNRHLRVL